MTKIGVFLSVVSYQRKKNLSYWGSMFTLQDQPSSLMEYFLNLCSKMTLGRVSGDQIWFGGLNSGLHSLSKATCKTNAFPPVLSPQPRGGGKSLIFIMYSNNTHFPSIYTKEWHYLHMWKGNDPIHLDLVNGFC